MLLKRAKISANGLKLSYFLIFATLADIFACFEQKRTTFSFFSFFFRKQESIS